MFRGAAIHLRLPPLWLRPRPTEPVRVVGAGPLLPRGHVLRVVSWNVQFCAGRRPWFFYDGGPDSRVARAEVEHTLAGVLALLRRLDADVVLLQEVDRGSARTHFVDQHARLRAGLGLACDASTPYFRVPWVPVPLDAPMGAVDMHLSVFSRFRLADGVRHRLPPLAEPAWRRVFNLRRALLHLPMPREGGGALQLWQTHLSAFSRGDGTLGRQVARVLERVRATAGPTLLVGDLNSLPPGDDPARLGAAAVLYADRETPIRPLVQALQAVFPPPGAALEPRARTYVPYGSNLPDRTIDYAFGRGLEVVRAEAIADGAAWSDHLPIYAELRLRDALTSGGGDPRPS